MELIFIGIVGALVWNFFFPSDGSDGDESSPSYISRGEQERTEDYGAWKKRRDDLEAYYKRNQPR